jgi:ribosomal-protein-alanine N-acetyltransferase
VVLVTIFAVIQGKTGEGKTRRLLLRPLEVADAGQIQLLFPHWEIVRYLAREAVPWPYPDDGALQYCRDIVLPAMEQETGWHWTIRMATDPSQVIGVIALEQGEEHNRGFWLGLPWHGRGLMSEACAWANDYWFETLGFPVLRTSKAIANAPSRRISQKQGMRVVAQIEKDYVCGRLPSEKWEISADEWRAWKADNHGLDLTS